MNSLSLNIHIILVFRCYLTALQAEDAALFMEYLSSEVANNISCLLYTQAHSSRVPETAGLGAPLSINSV